MVTLLPNVADSCTVKFDVVIESELMFGSDDAAPLTKPKSFVKADNGRSFMKADNGRSFERTDNPTSSKPLKFAAKPSHVYGAVPNVLVF